VRSLSARRPALAAAVAQASASQDAVD